MPIVQLRFICDQVEGPPPCPPPTETLSEIPAIAVPDNPAIVEAPECDHDSGTPAIAAPPEAARECGIETIDPAEPVPASLTVKPAPWPSEPQLRLAPAPTPHFGENEAEAFR